MTKEIWRSREWKIYHKIEEGEVEGEGEKEKGGMQLANKVAVNETYDVETESIRMWRIQWE